MSMTRGPDTCKSLPLLHRADLDHILRSKEDASLEAIFGLQAVQAIATAIDAKDEYTLGHSQRVACYSRAIAERLGWRGPDCANLQQMALLHDVGKIGVPDNILHKRGVLTDAEFAKVRRHPDIGAQILGEIKFLKNLEHGARFHHERVDGRGYPIGLQREEIPIGARIISVADAFDAMSSRRFYRDKLQLSVCRSELRRCAGTQFDPLVVGVFLILLDEGLAEAVRQRPS